MNSEIHQLRNAKTCLFILWGVEFLFQFFMGNLVDWTNLRSLQGNLLQWVIGCCIASAIVYGIYRFLVSPREENLKKLYLTEGVYILFCHVIPMFAS